MTLHSPTENSLAVLNHKILEANSQVQNVKLGDHPTCLSINRLWHELCDTLRRLVGTTAPGHHDCSIQEEKIVFRGSFVVKVTDSGPTCYVFNPSRAEEPPMHIKAQTSSHWYGVGIRRGDASPGVVPVT
ncbi:uncharacterized protein TNCV_3540231 [Trichonephila clavipes]|nr:uncharacterized protein TNCV_3540231 [Trichonephila clavipes]